MAPDSLKRSPTPSSAGRSPVPIAHNGRRLVRTRLAGQVQPAHANVVIDHAGRQVVRPGQGGVVLGVGLGDLADTWASDHLEPGASIGHPDHAANDALQSLCCVGNRAEVLEGPAGGAQGVVVGKHGAVLVAFAESALAFLGPGDWIAVEALGLGLAIEEEPEVACHSCSPGLLERLVNGRDERGRLRVAVVAELPAEAAGAGIGMPVSRYNLDLQVDQAPVAERAVGLRFGDVVALRDHDHRVGREHRRGWLAIGSIAHGHSVGGGHGLGFVTLLSGPEHRFALERSADSNLGKLLRVEWAP